MLHIEFQTIYSEFLYKIVESDCFLKSFDLLLLFKFNIIIGSDIEHLLL